MPVKADSWIKKLSKESAMIAPFAADQVKDGVVIIDVGVNRIGMAKNGKAILAGDVEFDSVKEKASYITPVPGGVGPMTITMLMKNTVQSARQAAGLI